MHTSDDFRFKAHQHLLDLDATTNQLMMLVIASEVSGPRWSEALLRQKMAYEAWSAILIGIQIDPMPIFDGRPPDGGNPPVG